MSKRLAPVSIVTQALDAWQSGRMSAVDAMTYLADAIAPFQDPDDAPLTAPVSQDARDREQARVARRGTGTVQVHGVAIQDLEADYGEPSDLGIARVFADEEVAQTYAKQQTGQFAGSVVTLTVDTAAPTVIAGYEAVIVEDSYRLAKVGLLTPESVQPRRRYFDDDRVPADATTEPVVVEDADWMGHIRVHGTDEVLVRRAYVETAMQAIDKSDPSAFPQTT